MKVSNIRIVRIVIVLAICCAHLHGDVKQPQGRPNILWITIEDWSPDLSCYGTKGIHTPHVDKLASQGVRYERAFTTSPVCSTSRSAMMTGFHQNYIGAHQHREHDKKPLPYGIQPIPHLFAEAGYFTALMSRKTDCNFTPNSRQELFMGDDWNERESGQPFFARITFGGTHRPWNRDPQRPIDIDDVELPPYYADTPFVRRDWANGLEQMQLVDREVGALLKRLDGEGLADNTIVFFIADHGRCHIRGKQFLYDGGIRIPMIMRWPVKVAPGQVNHDLVMSIDICATILAAAGIDPPVPLHGKSLFSDSVKQRKYVFAARDKMGETHDAMRAIRSKDYKLILNLMPERAYCQYSRYNEGAYPVLAEMNVLNLQERLDPQQAAFFARTKPPIELYDLRQDPYEVHNVANDSKYAEVKATLLAELDNWRRTVIKDKGVTDEFRAASVFPAECPTAVMDDWVKANAAEYDFNKHGWPAWYPTRTLADWEQAQAQWEPYVFRNPDDNVPRPEIVHANRKKKTPRLNESSRAGLFWDNWALVMPNGAAGWLTLSPPEGKPQGELWTVGGGRQLSEISVNGDSLSFTRHVKVGEPEFEGGPPTGRPVACKYSATVEDDVIRLVMHRPAGNGKIEKVPFAGKCIPPIPPKPDLSKVKFGEPIELFNGRDLDGWMLTNPKQTVRK